MNLPWKPSQAQQEELQRLSDYNNVFAGNSTAEEGQRVLEDLMREAWVFHTTIEPRLPVETIHQREGARELMLRVVLSRLRETREALVRRMSAEPETREVEIYE